MTTSIRYRMLDANGDYVFGQGSAEFLQDTPAAVAQAVQTRLKFLQGEWFLDLTDGTAYSTRILSEGTQTFYDQEIRDRILGTPGVTGILSYESVLNNRQLTVTATIDTAFGQTPISVVI